jgi:CelD/BcsL family acetyltransferase involved in cellulose biosynthesis
VHALTHRIDRVTGAVAFAFQPVGDALERQWRALDQSGSHSFFASWPWISAVLGQAPPGVAVLKATRGGSLAGLALCRRRWPGQTWFNALGDRALDGVMIEHNGFAVPGAEDLALIPALLDGFATGGMGTELVIPGMARRVAVPEGLIVLEETRKAYRTALSGLGPDGIAAVLSRNARQQLRRSLRDFGGELRVDVARDTATALDWFERMKQLHIRSWSRRGRANAFDNRSFEPFHRAVISAGATEGCVDLMRITAGERVLGYLYNFVRNGVVHAYQSGFSDDDPGLRPGYVCHALAIGHYARAGRQCYDFLAGTNRLKQSFGTECYEMVWRRYRRPTLAFRLDDFLRRQIGARSRKAVSEG